MYQARWQAHKDVAFPKLQPYQLHHHNSCHPLYHLGHLPKERNSLNTSQYRIYRRFLEKDPSVEMAQRRDTVSISRWPEMG